VGRVIKGTFSGIVSFALEDRVITEGDFRVKRVTNNIYNPG
jgi:hypothetical protein